MNKENKGVGADSISAQKGITRIAIVLIVCSVLVLAYAIFIYSNSIEKINLIYKSITKQINVEDEIQSNETLMGISDVSGEGITININDGKDLIHQEDLIIMIDELKNAGSQAISVNGIRVVNSSYIFCDGTVILIDGVKIGNPFIIKAIGNKELIYGAITRNGGYIETLKKAQIGIEVEKCDNIEISKSKKSEFDRYKSISGNINKLYQSNRIVGKTSTSGKGLEITIYEEKAKLTALTFLQMVNDLNSAGAEAIQINGNRVTAMTDLMDISKKYVLLNSHLISAPYTIKVIGNQEALIEKINASNSYFTKIKESGNPIYIDTKNVTVEEYVQKTEQSKLLIDYLK